ncbi:TPA: nucleotidyltransferase family protein [Pseudomonas aeruginosa]|nr:nucleotidyltransferase family protein [Pseudomonas aeruginosa]
MVAADEVLCLVLAAGQGRRFGSDKRLARLADGTTLLAASVARAREAFAEVRVAVRAGDTPASLGLPAQQRLVHSLDASLGMGHSLAAGVAAARNSTARAIAVLLGDMPWIAADTLERLAAMATPEAIVFPLYDGQRGHPVLFGRAFWDALAQLDGDQGARRVLQAYRPAWCEVPCDDPGVLRDVDTPAALG